MTFAMKDLERSSKIKKGVRIEHRLVECQFAPMNTFKYNHNENSFWIHEDSLYINAPEMRARYGRNNMDTYELSEEEYSYYKELHKSRMAQPASTISASSKMLRRMTSPREKLRLLQMGRHVCNYYRNTTVNRTPTDKQIVKGYNADKKSRSFKPGIEAATERYFDRVGIDPKTYRHLRPKEIYYQINSSIPRKEGQEG